MYLKKILKDMHVFKFLMLSDLTPALLALIYVMCLMIMYFMIQCLPLFFSFRLCHKNVRMFWRGNLLETQMIMLPVM